MKPQKRIRSRTAKRASEEARYRKRVRIWLEGKRCAVYPHLAADQNHHRRGRQGRLLLWEPGWLPVSAAGHDRINRFPDWAREMGYLCEKGQFNDQSIVPRD